MIDQLEHYLLRSGETGGPQHCPTLAPYKQGTRPITLAPYKQRSQRQQQLTALELCKQGVSK